MGRTKGTYTLTSNIEPKVGAPLDARTVVPLKTDLTANGTFDYPYIGLSVFVKEDNKRYTLIGSDPTVAANWREEGSGTSTSADHVTYDNRESGLESVNIQDAVDEIVDDLGSAAYKDVPESGNADATQVVMGNDSRLTDSRNANDVYPWAKSVNKPEYTYSEIQNTPTLGTAAAKDYTTSVTEDSNDLVTSGAVYTALENFPTEDTKVTQTATNTNANYEILFSETADNTTRTEGAGKAATLRFNPSKGAIMEGNNTVASGNYSHAEGSGTTANDDYTHAEGYNTSAFGLSSHAEGYSSVAAHNYTHAEGFYTCANGINSHTEGEGSVTSGRAAHAEGLESTASGISSHSEGYRGLASGNGAHAEGGYASAGNLGTFATGENSHTEGHLTTASGESSHAEGYSNIASGMFSHTEGYKTKTLGVSSHAEGSNTTAQGHYSHTEGVYTLAGGNHSHAEGNNTSAVGMYSHAAGQGTCAEGVAQTVVGKYNIADDTSLFIVGNGTKSSTRSNALKVDSDGTTTLGVSGTITSGNSQAVTGGAVYDALQALPSDDTWRNIKVNGTEKLGTANTTGAVDFVNGTNTTVSFDTTGNKIKIDAVDTTYEEATTSVAGLMSASDKTKLNNIAPGAEVNVQSDWNQTTTTADDYIKNKPTLGTAAAKNVPATGNASTTEVVMGSDTRLTDSRPASDVYDWAKAATKPTYTKSEVGLGNVDNTSDATKKTNFTGNIASGNTGFVTGGDAYTALNGKLNTGLKGAANGLAELDADGKVPSSQLPSYVDDVIEVEDYAHLPITGVSGKIYVTLDTNLTYRWSGTGYTEISASLALGETSSTAYRGDRGKTAYDHAIETKLSTTTASGLYKVAGTAQGHIASLTAVQKSDITALGIPGSDTNTTYTFEGGTNSFKVTPSGASAQTVTVTPSIADATTSASGLMSASDKTKLNGIATGAEVNQNAFSTIGVKVGSTTTNIAADSKTDTVTLIQGSNVTLTADATNDTVTIAATDTNTHRPIQVNGTQNLGNNTTALNLKNGTNITITADGGNVTIATSAEVNQNAFSNVKVGSTTVAADSKTDTLELVAGSNVTLTPDATNDKITIAATDTNTTYTFAGGTNKFTVTPSGGSAQDVTITPSIANNITGSGTSGYLTKFNGTNTITNGPQLGSSTTTYLRNDGSWATPTDTNNRKSFYGTCDTAAATVAKVITLADTSGWELKAGTIVGVKFTYDNTATNCTLNVNNTGAKQVWYNNAAYTGSSAWVFGQAARMTYYMYDGSTYWIWMGLSRVQDDNTYNRNKYEGAIKCGTTAITAANIIVGKEGVYHHLKDGTAFDINYPILYAGSNIAASATSTNNYDIIHFTITTTQSISLTAYLPVYIKGSLSGIIFTPVSTTPLTQTIPTVEDGYYYIFLGMATSTTTVYLQERHPIFKYIAASTNAFVEIVNDAYAYKHLNGWSFTATRPLAQYVTFDQSSPPGGPANRWYNGFVSSHNNYLASYIINEHRSANWYVGYGEYSTSTGTAPAPTWYLLLHSGNYSSYAAKKTEAIKNITRSGTTFTATRTDDTTFTFTQQDNNTTYTFAGGTNSFTVTPSGASAQTVSITVSDSTKLPLTGGSLSGGLEIKGVIAGDTGSTGHGLWGGGGYHNAYNNIILHGDNQTGTSGIAFVSDKTDGTTITNINQPSDRAFIQYHAYGITTATAEATNPTLATSGESGRLVIGIGNDGADQVWLQTPSRTGLIHQVASASYVIPDTNNTTGSVGSATQPVYVDGGAIKGCTYSLNATVPSGAVFTDTTYTFAGGTNQFTVTPAGGSAQTVTVTPSITNNITGSGTSGYIAKFNGANTITNGPAFGSATTTYLRNDGTWATPPNDNTDTKVTQTATTTNANYEVLFSATADNTTRTEGAGKTSTLLYNPNTAKLSGMFGVQATEIGVSANNGTTGGISLYNGVRNNGVEEYGIAFRSTSNMGKHGYVQGDWATYFTMNNTANRGWVFRRYNDNTNVASISNTGNAVFNGSVTVGGNTANTSGGRMEYNATNHCIDFIVT